MLKSFTHTTHSIINDKIADSIKEIISKETLIDLTHFDNFFFRKRISFALSFLKVTPENIISKTNKLDSEKIDIIKNFLYPGENELFRDTETWIFLRDKILSEISYKTNPKLLIYNSTTGEDLYSLLIILNEYFPDNNIEITVTSPSNYSINKITDGDLSQPKNRSSNLNFKTLFSNKEISKYIDINNNIIKFNKRFLNNIIFKQHTIGNSVHINEYDLVLCRNKTLPFAIENINIVLEEIISLVKPTGYLVFGINENLPKEYFHLFNVISNNEKIFIKKTNGK